MFCVWLSLQYGNEEWIIHQTLAINPAGWKYQPINAPTLSAITLKRSKSISREYAEALQ
jgi:hypothetical protein